MSTEEKSLSSDSLKTKSEQSHVVSLPVEQNQMVNWYHPGMLLRVAVQTVVSQVFGKNADFRYLQSLGPQAKIYYDYSVEYTQDEQGQYAKDEMGFYIPDQDKPRKELWLDYISDTGDGWNSTYTVAYYAAQDSLTVPGPEGAEYNLPCANVLLFGGDQVYPSPSKRQYRNRLINPFGSSLPRKELTRPHPRVFAIPGNHDWYDSLVNFIGIFCSKHWFNGWQTPQTCSYFALKLPHKWWLFGTDVQLRSDLDQQQLRYFESVCELVGEEDRVILCNAESWWIDAKKRAQKGEKQLDNTLDFLVHTLLGKKVRVFLAGNQHYYRRFEHIPIKQDGTPDQSSKIEKITAGGGGAFLHPTHDIKFDTVEDVFEEGDKRTTREYHHIKCYPDQKTSRRLCRNNLLFLKYNKSFGLITAILYLLTSWMVMLPIGDYRFSEFPQALLTALHRILASPAITLWFAAVLMGFWFFTDTHSRLYKLVGGLIHGMANLLTIFLVSWASLYFCQSVLSPVYPVFRYQGFAQMIVHHALVFTGGWIAGSFIMGIYLYISLNVFGRHYSEAFSSLHIEDWKNFLRMHIDTDGRLTIYPIGIKRVPRKWKENNQQNKQGSLYLPDDPKATRPELIEAPIVLERIE